MTTTTIQDVLDLLSGKAPTKPGQPVSDEKTDAKPADVEDRRLRRIRFKNPAAIRAWAPTADQIIHDHILDHKDRSLTYMSLAFARVRLIDDHDIARVVLNRYTRRFEMHLNIRRIRGYHIAMMLRRAEAPRFPGDRVKMEPIEVELEDVAAFGKSVAKTVDQLVLHEFGHLWFKHLKYEVRKAPPEARPFLNVATDSLVNYHLKVKLGIYKLHDRPVRDAILALTPILFPMMRVNYGRFDGLQKKEILKLGQDPALNDEDYAHWRVIASQFLNFRTQGLASIRDSVQEIQQHSREYTASITEIAQKVAALFPERPTLDTPCPGRSKRPGGAGDLPDEFIDVQDLPPEEIPPQFDDVLHQILAGRGGAVMHKLVGEARDITASQRVIMLLRENAERDPGKFIIQAIGKTVESRVLTTWRPSKRPVMVTIALTNAFARSEPARFRTTRTIQDKIAANKLDLYVDVSGSFQGYHDRLYPFMRDLSRTFNVTGWQFSTVIMPLNRHDVEEGLVTTTDGTDGNAILRHMRQRFEQGVRKFTVMGDRAYGQVSEDLLSFPEDVWITDVHVGGHCRDTWFRSSPHIHVIGLSLDSDFQVIEESIKQEGK